MNTTRYWDGLDWVGDPVPVETGAKVVVSRDRRLTAVGVMHLIAGGLTAVSPLLLALVVRGEAVLWLPIMIPLCSALAAPFISVGRRCLRGSREVWTGSIALGSIPFVLFLVGLAGEDPLASLCGVLWFGTIIGLSVAVGRATDRPTRTEAPSPASPPSDST